LKRNDIACIPRTILATSGTIALSHDSIIHFPPLPNLAEALHNLESRQSWKLILLLMPK
jgi:hypothetical protein